jgi:hypothetical protein
MESPLWEERQGKDDDGAEEAPVAEEREDEHAAADGHLGQQHHPRVEELHQHYRRRGLPPRRVLLRRADTCLHVHRLCFLNSALTWLGSGARVRSETTYGAGTLLTTRVWRRVHSFASIEKRGKESCAMNCFSVTSCA